MEACPEGRRVTDIARALELPKSAVHRLLVTFQAHGFVQQHSDSRYALGPALARLGLSAAEMFIPSRVAHPHIEALAHEVEETVLLGVLVQAEVMIIDKVEWGRGLRISATLSTVLPLPQTGLGKLLLAFCPAGQRDQVCEVMPQAESGALKAPFIAALQQELAAIKRQGFAVSLEEWIPDVCCVVVPIRNRQGAVSAALALALPRSRMPQSQRHDPFAGHHLALQDGALLPALHATAARISEALP